MLFIIAGGLCCYISGALIGRGLQTRARYAAHALGLVGMVLAGWGFWQVL